MSISSISNFNPQPQELKNIIEKNTVSKKEQLEESTRMFEGSLTRLFLGDALKPMVKGYLNQEGASNDIQRYFMTDMLAESMSHKSVWGVSNMLQAKLSNTNSLKSNE